MEISSYQKKVLDFVAQNPTKSLVINAKAGSGKTTTSVMVAKQEAAKGYSVAMAAFNKSIAKELESRMQGFNIDCFTMHSHGFKALSAFFGRKLKTNSKKWTEYISSNLETLSVGEFGDNNQAKYGFISNCVKLLDLCRINLVKHGDTKEIEDISVYYGIDIECDEVDVVNHCLSLCYKADEPIVDFVDMIVLPSTDARITRKLAKYDFFIIDECQDLNKAQQALLYKSIKTNGRFMAVGDPQQAINGFCGADANSFSALVEKANGNELPLSVCYRCGSTIIDAAKKYVADIEAFEGSSEGLVTRQNHLNNLNNGDMVICRKAAPLVSLCLKLIVNGYSARVKGTDIAEGLKNLIKKLKPTSIDNLYLKLEVELEKKVKNLEKLGIKGEYTNHCASIETFKDKIECIKAIADSCLSIAEIITKLDNLFTDYRNGNCIMLSTIHKAKGLEADNVFIIIPNKLPLVWKDQKDWQKVQEENLCYVAITRAKKMLTYIDLDEDELAEYQF